MVHTVEKGGFAAWNKRWDRIKRRYREMESCIIGYPSDIKWKERGKKIK